MISDKEVGELWLAAYRALESDGACTLWAKAVINLIRKLVEDVAELELKYSDVSRLNIVDLEEAVNLVLKRFGIDPKEYNG